MKYIVIILLICLFLTACTAGRNPLRNTQDKKGNIAGFFKGFWHGLISIFSLILSVFTKNITVYEVHNTGFWYTFGFLL